jgi:hypothetical protein
VSPHGKEQERLDEANDAPVYGNVIPPVLGLIGIAAVVCVMWALDPAERGSGERFTPCVSIANEQVRLACYDQIAALHQPAKGAFAPAQIQPRKGSQ